MAQTPAIPPNCQWALFLRNHDELTLEMVTDEDRDYMWRTYAADRQARINLGIRRRLGPLLQNHRLRIHLMNGLLVSFPGTPIIYYGDEIGMGDNIYLGDRNGVRTPMQWSADRNAGFSKANPQKLYLPVIIDPQYHYEQVNVEAQQSNPHSLLWWMKRLIAQRKRYRAFGRGTMEFVQTENRKILAFIRRYEDETILVVANLSRYVQCCELDLSQYKGMVPVELSGSTRFPEIGERPYFINLGPFASYWFAIARLRDGLLVEPVGEAKFADSVLELIVRRRRVPGGRGAVAGHAARAFRELRGADLPSQLLKAEQSNTAIVFDDTLFLKLFRRVETGINTDVEMTQFLNETSFAATPPLAGTPQYRADG